MESSKKIQAFFQKYPSVKINPSEIIFKPNQEIKKIYYLENGYVRQFSSTLKAEEVTLHIFTAGALFPLANALSNLKNTYYHKTLNEITVRIAPVDEVIDFIKNDIEVSFELLTNFASGLVKVLRKTEYTLYHDSYYKVVSILIYLAEKFGKEKEQNFTKIDFSLTHNEVASWVGMQRETASRQLEILEEKGLIKTKDHFIYIDLENLIKEKKDYDFFKLKN